MSTDDPSPFAGLRGVGEARKPSTQAAHTTQHTRRTTKDTHGAVTSSRARVTTIPKPRPLKQPMLPHTSEVRQAVRVDSGPMAGPTKKPHNDGSIRPATVTGRVASKSLTKPTPAPRIPVRSATSASFRPQTTKTKAPSKLQTGATPPVAHLEIIFGFEGINFRGDDFMFDV
jgi:hypothetical protein